MKKEEDEERINMIRKELSREKEIICTLERVGLDIVYLPTSYHVMVDWYIILCHIPLSVTTLCLSVYLVTLPDGKLYGRLVYHIMLSQNSPYLSLLIKTN